MESPLSFDSSENFRKKLLIRNLKPYSVDQVFNSSDVAGISDITLIDYSVIDSPSIEEIGQKQEGILYVQNQYAPNNQKDLYGNVVNINLNQNTKSNDGVYDFSKTIGSELENKGNSQELLLYVNNLYGPSGDNKFGNTVDINQNLQTIGNLGEYNLNFTIGSKLETNGDSQEIFLYTNNIYGPQNKNSYGDTVNINQNLQSTSNLGEYDITDTYFSKLQNIGNFQETILYTNNKYGPANSTSYGTTVEINQNKQSTANLGLYNDSAGVYGDDLTQTLTTTKTPDQSRNDLYVVNEYGPGTNNGYGNLINPIIGVNQQTTANKGVYDSNVGIYGDDLTLTLTTTKTPDQSRNDLYVINEFGPDDIDGYGFGINPIIGANLQTSSNQGPYNENTSSGPELTSDQSRTIAFVKNEYGPDSDNGYGDQINSVIDINLQTTANKGLYDQNVGIYGDDLTQTLTTTKSPIQSQSEAYGDNKYVSGEGSYEIATIKDVTDIIERTFLPYAESETTFIFVPSFYTPFDILQNPDPQGSDGSLSQDSSLAQLGAEKLQKEFKARVALELLQQTVNKVNALDSSIDTDTGQISSKPNTDPFNAVGIISGNIPLLARDFSVTSPDLFLGQGINFAAKLAGLYSPYSYIPGEYFDYPKKRLVNQLIENPVAAVVGSVLGTINKLTSLNIENGSELFLANTSNATSDLLFQQLSYNSYRPDYRLNSLRDPNILAPKPSYYVGDRKTFLKSITPIDQQPVNRFGDNTEAAVFGHAGLGTDYETYKDRSVGKRFLFGLNSRGFYDGSNNPNGIDSGTIYGGFTWGSSRSGTLGKKVGFNNEVFESSAQDEGGLLSGLKDTLAGDFNDFRPDSILDVTTKLVQKSEEAKGLYKQRHVGNAISQVSKVFNDGNIELTRGSRVIRYSTPTSVGSQNENDVVGFEYARVFTKDNPYFLYNNLQKTDGNIRKFTNSVLTNTYNLNIAPTMDQDSTSVDWKAKKVKKYMFSLENLAWRTSNRPGYTVEELPVSEIGPNGGRIMWFPPYNLTFDESVKTNWTDHTFLGRTEPVYTYSNTSRSGSLSFKIVVDHPSILNTIVKKELQKTAPESRLTKVIDSFFAGCTKYDIYELLKRFAEFSISDVYDVLQTLDESNTKPNPNEQGKPKSTASGDFTSYFNKVALYFDSSEISIEGLSYSGVLDSYVTNITNNYPLKSENKIINYDSETYSGETDTNLKSDTNFFLQYIDSTNDGIEEFKSFIESNNTKFGELKNAIKKFLEQKETNELTLELRGNILPYLGGVKNKSIAKDRIKTIEKYFEDDEFLKAKLQKKKFKIKDKTENKAIKILTQENNYDKIDCSRNYKGANNETRTGEFSVNAMACRSVQVTNIVTKEGPEEDNNKDSENTSVGSNVNGAEEQGQDKSNSGLVTPATQPPTRKDIVKRLLRKLLKESDYFEMIRENEPMIYDGIKQKIRHFDPAFHSITPEGLNSRLTFLQQCMRPGDTIPTVRPNSDQPLDYGDAFNTAFGAPPVCILRVGDFFHTKVIIDSLNITYDEVPFDLNPEGIGVQPMIADVKIGFNFIGGQGLKEPVEQLQNALTFNYYGNTEVYDERAVETEAVSEELTAELIALAQDALGIVTDFSKNNTNDGGATIGKIIDQTVDPASNTITGNIDYQGVFSDFVDTTRNYYESTFNIFEKLTKDYSSAGISLIVKDRTYVEGTFKTNSDVSMNIFGHPIDIQKKVEDLFSGLKDDIENGGCPLFANIENQNFKNADIRDVKRKLKQKTEEKQSQYLTDIKTILKDNPKNEIDLINFIDKFSFVNGNIDGYKNKKNTPIIFNLSGATKLQELKDDLNSMATDINDFYQDLYKYKVIPSGDYEFKSDFNYLTGVVTYDEPNKAPYNRFYLVWGKTVLDGNFGEIITIVTSGVSNDDKTKWVEFLNTNIESEAAYYRGEKQEGELFISNLKNSENYQKFSSNEYKRDLKNKDRKLNYQKQDPTNQNDGDNLIKLYQSVTAPGPKFNLVKQFRG